MEQTPIQKYMVKLFSECIIQWLLEVASDRKGINYTLRSNNHPMQGMPIEPVGFHGHQDIQCRDIHPKCLAEGHNYQALIKWIWNDLERTINVKLNYFPHVLHFPQSTTVDWITNLLR